VEIAFEAVPGGVLQCFAVLKHLQDGVALSKQAIASIGVSAICVGFTSASISYDNDTDVRLRRSSPRYYGWVPDGIGATAAFLAMTANSSLLLILRSTSAGFLLLVNPMLLLLLTLFEIAVQVSALSDRAHARQQRKQNRPPQMCASLGGGYDWYYAGRGAGACPG
jgi:hypothetical protein